VAANETRFGENRAAMLPPRTHLIAGRLFPETTRLGRGMAAPAAETAPPARVKGAGEIRPVCSGANCSAKPTRVRWPNE